MHIVPAAKRGRGVTAGAFSMSSSEQGSATANDDGIQHSTRAYLRSAVKTGEINRNNLLVRTHNTATTT